jgi:uroporphyrinogen decarboxylase
MKSKERVYKAIRHEEADRLPIYIWYHPDVIKSLEKKYNKKGKELEIFLGNDILQTWVSINYYQSVVVEENSTFTDEYGIKWHRVGGYNMVTHNPIKDWDVNSLGDYKFPDPFREGRFMELKSLLDNYGKEYFIGADVSGTMFEPCSHIRGMEQLLLDMFTDPDALEPFFDNAMDFSLQVSKSALEMNVDWIWLGDDVGTQGGMILSPDMWRKFFKPRMAKIIKELRSIKKDLIIAYHSCGTIKPIIPDLIEIGVNVLNPIQPKAKDMDMYAIKKEFGDRLALHCGMDTQDLLPFGTLEDIENEVKKMIKFLAKDGGFIFTASHTIQPDTTDERIILMLDTLKKYGSYPISL